MEDCLYRSSVQWSVSPTRAASISIRIPVDAPAGCGLGELRSVRAEARRPLCWIVLVRLVAAAPIGVALAILLRIWARALQFRGFIHQGRIDVHGQRLSCGRARSERRLGGAAWLRLAVGLRCPRREPYGLQRIRCRSDGESAARRRSRSCCQSGPDGIDLEAREERIERP